MQKGEAFLASPAVQAALSSEQGKRCSAQSIYVLEGQVPAELEAIFCRGIEWDCGVEHVLLLQVRSTHLMAHVCCRQPPVPCLQRSDCAVDSSRACMSDGLLQCSPSVMC